MKHSTFSWGGSLSRNSRARSSSSIVVKSLMSVAFLLTSLFVFSQGGMTQSQWESQMISAKQSVLNNPAPVQPHAMQLAPVVDPDGGQPINGCYIAHDPMTWTQPTFVNNGSGGDSQDDGSAAALNLPFTFDLYGTEYSSLYININGNVSFGSAYWQYTALGFPSNDFVMVAPFWADLDLGGSGEIWYKVTPHAVYINWVGVGYFNEHTDKVNTFQLILTDGLDPILGVGNNVGFFYADMDWTTGDASGGFNGLGGTAATVGVNKGDGSTYVQIGRFDQRGYNYDGPLGNNDGVDWLDGQCLQFDLSGDENFPPIAVGFPTNNYQEVCPGTTTEFQVSFVAPELNQLTHSVVDGTFDGFNIVSNVDGNASIVTFTVEATTENLGLHTITFTGTDNDANDPRSTTITLTINVTTAACPCQPMVEIACPANVFVECDSDLNDLDLTGSPSYTALELCGGQLEVSYDDVVISADGCSSVIARTWTAYIIGGPSSTCTQIITLIDTHGPVISGFEPVVNVQCVSDVPAPSATATDACSSASDVTSFMSNVGELASRCTLSTAFGPGADWAFWVPELSSQNITSSANFVFASNGYFDTYVDGTAHLYGTVVNNENSNEQFLLDLWFHNKASWASWSSMGRGYKDDLNCATPSSLYELWDYYEMVNGFSTATGQGDLAGVELYLEHMPANYYFGFQIGQGANNKNCNYGLSGWFTYHGFNGTDHISGHGDVNVDADCGNGGQSDCLNNTEFVYLYRSLDECGRATIATQHIIVEDTIAPEFTNCMESFTIECSDAIPAAVAPNAVDNCSGEVSVVAQEEVWGGTPCAQTLTRTWFATDACGNRSACSYTITIVDTTAPAFDSIPAAEITVECSNVTAADVLTATDNCADSVGVNYFESIEEGNCAGNYTIYRSWSVSDNCDNSTSVSQIVHVVDTTAPQFDEYPYYTHIECTEVDGYMLTATDNCSGVVSVSITFEELNSGGCLGVLHRIYEAVDGCGNVATAEQYISIQDHVAPTIVGIPAESTVECSSVSLTESGLYFGQGEVVGQDNCGGDVSIAYTEEIVATDDSCANSFDIIRHWTATDYCENVSEGSTIVHVVDTEGPIFEYVPADFTISCELEIPFETAVVYDLCGEATLSHTDTEVAGECANERVITRLWRAYDACGNYSMATTTITVIDETAPIISGEASLSVECGQDVPYVEASAYDNCSAEVTITFADVEVSNDGCTHVINRVFTATDACGNSADFTQVITITDTTAPVFNEYEVEITRPCSDYAGTFVSATDVCNNFEITYSDEHVSGGCQGRIIRSYTATDACGNSSSAMQIITLVDETAPVVVEEPADMTYECTDEWSPANVSFTDNCDDELMTSFDYDFTFDGCTYVYTFTWSATDNCNNTTTVDQVVTVQDTQAPWFTFVPESYTIECSETPEFLAPTAEDACSEVMISESIDTLAGTCASNYMIVRTFTATDACGNSASVAQEITVQDTTAPVWNYEASQSQLSFECDEERASITPVASDNCSEISIELVAETLFVETSCYTSGAYIFVATDACGNESYPFYQFFTVEDTTAPVVAEYEVEISRPCDDYAGIFISATDNCNNVEITYSDEHVSGGCQGRIIRTYSVVDACGNVAGGEYVQIITLTDETAPVVVAEPADMTLECGIDEVPGFEPEFTDNCDSNGIEVEAASSITPISCGYEIYRTWVATDNCGNETTVDQIITVIDTQDPWFTFVPEGYSADCSDELSYDNASAQDACDQEIAVSVSVDTIAGNCPSSYTIVRTFTASDACGHTVSASQEINVSDVTAPYFTFIPEGGYVACADFGGAEMATAADNCSTFELTSSDVEDTFSNEEVCGRMLTRSFVATDACGNSATASVTYYIYDNVAPVFVGSVSNVEVSCAGDVPAFVELSATDACSTATVERSTEVLSADECGNQVIEVSYVATDACGNAAYTSYTITVNDTTAPELVGAPTQSEVVLACSEEIPAAPVVTATDNCDQNVTVSYNETIVNEELIEGSVSVCHLITPVVPNQCIAQYDNQSWAMVLFGLPSTHRYYHVVSGGLYTMNDGSVKLIARLGNAFDSSRGFDVNVTFGVGMDWSTWDAQAWLNGFKADCDGVAANHTNWMYFLLQNTAGAELTGYGAYAGTTLNLVHAPSNNFYAFQQGLGANNVSAGEGFGGWFTHSGNFYYNEQQVTIAAGAGRGGDFAFELDCCPRTTVYRCWTAMDCSGNETSVCQTIRYENAPVVTPAITEALNAASTDAKEVAVAVYPNPANEQTTIAFRAVKTGKTVIEIFDMAGAKVAQVYNTEVVAGTDYKVSVDVKGMATGVYSFRVNNAGNTEVGRLIISK